MEGLLDQFSEAVLTVTGDCMRPVLQAGDRVRLESARRRAPRLGDIVLVSHPHGLRLHRVIWKGARAWRTKGDRSFHADPRVRPGDVIATVTALEGGRDVRRGWKRATLRSLLGAASARLRAAGATAAAAMLLAGAALPAGAQTCTFPAGGTITGVVNTYYPGVGTPAAGATSIQVDTTAIRGATGTPIAAGDMLLVIQMQDAQINDGNTAAYGDGAAGDPATGSSAINNSGVYEYVVAVGAVAGGAVAIIGANATTAGLLNSYATAPTDDQGTVRRGQRTFQVIRVPRYQTATLGAGLTAAAWNGRTGGVLAVDVAGAATLGGTVSVDGLGFRGGLGVSLDGGGGANTDYRTTGATATNGYKGEGIAGTPRSLTFVPGPSGTDGYPRGDKARGAPGNGGGGGTDGNPVSNDQNAGGGGGANGGNGGQGGNTWASNLARGGFGGTAVAASVTRIVMGGGGGAGSVNDCSTGAGASGGGIVLLRAESVAGTGTLSARGATAANAGQDGAGGGGAGGSVVVVTASGTLAGLSVDVRGGNGGYSNLQSPPAPAPGPACLSGTAHGPGGGGGGGVALLSGAPGTAVVTGGTNGLTNVTSGVHNGATQAYGATAGAAGFLQTTVTRATVPGVLTCLASTRATIVGLRVEPSGTIEFATGLQRGTVGFNVYATRPGRRRARSTPLNAQLIAAPMPDSITPIFYRVETAPVAAPSLFIEEIQRSGRRRMMGPFAVDDAALRAAFDEAQARYDTPGRNVRELRGARVPGAAVPAGGWRPRTPRPRDGSPSFPAVKVEVSAAGTVTVPLAELAAQGLAEALEAPRRLRVWNAGQPVPARLLRSGGATHLSFGVDGFRSDYTDRNAYLVTAAATPPAPSVEYTRSGPAPLPGALVIEQDVLYAPFLPREADPWVWDFLVSGSPAGPYTFDVPAPPVAGVPVPVRVIVVSLTDHEHAIEASLNGVAIGRVTFSGQAVAEIFGQVPASAVRAGANEVTFSYTAAVDDPDDVGLAVLDRIELGVPHPRPLTPVAYELSPYDPVLPRTVGADYLVVTHELFRAQADQIAALKAAEGYRPVVVDVARAYDRFSGGVFEAQAVRALIRHAARRGGVRYVLLVGDDTFDPRDRLGLGLTAYVPSLNGWDGEFGRVPSENRYADLDGDGRPEVAIGRLPVQTPEQADVLVDKIARQSAVLRESVAAHLIAVDNDGLGDASFRTDAEGVAARLGAAVAWADLAAGLGPARAALFDALAAGAPTTHYFGHAGHERWADEGLLTSADVPALGNVGAETVLFTWACEAQWYQYDWGSSLNEALLLAPRAGALAAVGPTGITDPAYQSALHKRLYGHFLAGVPLGEALRRAKAEVLELGPSFAPVAEGWSLLGDPALKLP